MKAKQPLTKENFWNEMEQLYPEGLRIFDAWLEEYKARIKWLHVFGLERGKYIKYHDLPLAMQAGIFMEFTHDQKGLSDEAFRLADIRSDISFIISVINTQIKEGVWNR